MPKKRMYMRICHAPENLLTLVSDVEDYPRFVNLISSLRITNERKIGDNKTEILADAIVSYKMINETFESIVEIDDEAKTIIVRKTERGGPLRSLINDWKFHELSDGSTLVEFFVEVRLKAFPLEMLLAQKFDGLSEKIMTAFHRRADDLFVAVGEPKADLSEEYARLGFDGVTEQA